MYNNIAVLGSSGAIGNAFIQLVARSYPGARIHAFSQSKLESNYPNIIPCLINYEVEQSIAEAATYAYEFAPLDLVFVATGMLHNQDVTPEKSLKDISAKKLTRLFASNTILPALIAKHFLPLLNKKSPAIFAVLSARVGSISDNYLGGWYSYRTSKAGLNMIVKTAAIEVKRTNKQAIVVGLHPGTVDSSLSKPFQANIANDRLFSPNYSAECLLTTLNKLEPRHSGGCYAWDGKKIEP